jgi:hypothetical protein
MNDPRSVRIVVLLLTAGLGCADRTSLGTAGAPDDYQVRALRPPAPTPGSFTPILETDPPLDNPAWIVRVAQHEHTIQSIAITGQYLYFAAAREGVYRVAKAGGPLEVVEAAAGTRFDPITTTATGVYWTRMSFDEDDYPHIQIKHKADAGGPVSLVFEGDWGVASSNLQSHFQANESSIYMISGKAGAPIYDLYRVPSAGGAMMTMLALDGPFAWPSWLVDESSLYFMSCNNGTSCALQAVPKEGGTPKPLARFPGGGTLLAADADRLYVRSATDTTSLLAVSKQGDDAVPSATLAIGSVVGPPVLVDDQNVYFTSSYAIDGAELRAQPKDGRAAFTIAKGPLFYGSIQIVQDEDAFYILRAEGAEVSVVQKPR